MGNKQLCLPGGRTMVETSLQCVCSRPGPPHAPEQVKP